MPLNQYEESLAARLRALEERVALLEARAKVRPGPLGADELAKVSRTRAPFEHERGAELLPVGAPEG